MTYSLSVWLDSKTAKALELLCQVNERSRSNMVKVLIRYAARELEKQSGNIPPASSYIPQADKRTTA
jgi:hypothetical protein